MSSIFSYLISFLLGGALQPTTYGIPPGQLASTRGAHRLAAPVSFNAELEATVDHLGTMDEARWKIKGKSFTMQS